MADVALDFGTSNTVLARFNQTTGRAETIQIPGISTEMRYRLTPDGQEFSAWVVPSMIHYSETEMLIGDQVVSRGLADHQDTFRWMKRSIAQGISKRKKTAQGHKSPAQAGEDFLGTLLRYVSDRVSFEDDAFTFTAPVEAFENFQDWLWRLGESLGVRRVRMLDEPTACVFGYHGAARKDDRFVVVDFGGGTLDISAVRIDTASTDDRKAVQIGQAGDDLGGMDIDLWLAEDFAGRHRLDPHERRELEALILRQAESVKMALSDPGQDDADLTVVSARVTSARLLRTMYRKSCPACEAGRARSGESSAEGCLGCILGARKFLNRVRETFDRAIENASIKAGMRRADVTRVLVTGGTSLIPSVRRFLEQSFAGRVEFDHPFDSVVRGACRGVISPILQHDYALESYSRERARYEFMPLFSTGTEYPTADEAKMWCKGSTDGMTRIGLKIFEVSRMKRSVATESIVNERGVLQAQSQVASDHQHICLNPDNPTFIVADPPVNLRRDAKRFLASFSIDGNRRLLVTVVDNLTGGTLLRDHPVVRL